MRSNAWLGATLAVVLVACGGSSNDPPPPPPATGANTCAILKSCGLDTSGVSCDDTTVTSCNQCVAARSCGEIAAGACSPPCETFKKK